MAVTVTNNTKAIIRVRVTTTGEGGGALGGFFDIDPARASVWARNNEQVVFVKRDDNGQTETHVVEANQGLVIG